MICYNNKNYFSIDFLNWFAENQIVNVSFSCEGKTISLKDATILNIEFPSEKIVFLKDDIKYSVDYNQIESLKTHNNRVNCVVPLIAPDVNFLISKSIKGFSVDAKNFYYIGQKADIYTNKEHYYDVVIEDIISDYGNEKIKLKTQNAAVWINTESIVNISYTERRIQFKLA